MKRAQGARAGPWMLTRDAAVPVLETAARALHWSSRDLGQNSMDPARLNTVHSPVEEGNAS